MQAQELLVNKMQQQAITREETGGLMEDLVRKFALSSQIIDLSFM